MKREGGREGPLVHQAVHPDLPLLLPSKGRGAQDLVHYPRPLGAREERCNVITAKKPGIFGGVSCSLDARESRQGREVMSGV